MGFSDLKPVLRFFLVFLFTPILIAIVSSEEVEGQCTDTPQASCPNPCSPPATHTIYCSLDLDNDGIDEDYQEEDSCVGSSYYSDPSRPTNLGPCETRHNVCGDDNCNCETFKGRSVDSLPVKPSNLGDCEGRYVCGDDNCNCDYFYGDDYYTCGVCVSSSQECHGGNSRTLTTNETTSLETCCVNQARPPLGVTGGECVYDNWERSEDHCNRCGGGDWLQSGETGAFGNYANLGNIGCCNDAGSNPDEINEEEVAERKTGCTDEYPSNDFLEGHCGPSSNKFPATPGLREVCCQQTTPPEEHAVYNGLCLPLDGPYPLIGKASVYASGGVWFDCDNNESTCSLCEHDWIPGGEYDEYDQGLNPLLSNLGEYDFVTARTEWPTECCRDDSDESNISRKIGCLGNNCGSSKSTSAYPNNWPEFNSDPSDKVCCSDTDDAVYNARCFEDKKDPNEFHDLVGGPYHFDGTTITVADATNVPNLVANKNVWYDCDSDEATCTGNRADGLCGFNWTKSGEYPKGPGVYPSNQLPSLVQCIGEHAQLDTAWSVPADDSRVINECCGDDPLEVYVNSSQGLPTALNPTGKYEACCNVETDCVDYDGTCVTTCEFAESTNPNYPAVNKPFYCVLNNWWPKLYGTVTDVNGASIDGVLVTAVGAYHKSVKHGVQLTENNGNYVMYIPNSTYDVIASKPQEGYEDTIFFSVPIHEPTELNFVLRRPSTDCNDDCTRSDGLCHADCDGKELCDFPDDPDTLRNLDLAKECDLSAPGAIRLSDNRRFFQCCTGGISGKPYYSTPTDVKVCGENVVSSVRPVLLKGQLVNMIVTVFQQPSGPCT